MSDYFRMIKDGEKQPQVTSDMIDRNYLRKSKAEYERNLKKYDDEMLKKSIGTM